MIGIYTTNSSNLAEGIDEWEQTQRKQNWEDLELKACGSEEEEGILADAQVPGCGIWAIHCSETRNKELQEI